MSAKAMGRVWEMDLPHGEQLVLLAMADHADHNGDNVYPSVSLIAWKTGYSERQVRRILQKLLKLGVLELVESRGERGSTNVYRIRFDRAAYKQPLRGDDKMSPCQNVRGDIAMSGGGDIAMSGGGDIAMSPEPSLTVREPSERVPAAARASHSQTTPSRTHTHTRAETPTHGETSSIPATHSESSQDTYAKDEYEQEWTELGKAIIEVCRLSPQRAARMAKFRDAREALWRAGKRAADVRRWYESYWRSKRFNPGRCETDPYPQQVADEIERANPRPARPSNDTIVSPGAGTLVKVRSAR